ncbi:MAG: MFS transporter [Pseudorhodobacter sp.]|nr:MFS transporter [Pseudorhodobacter sp.]
MGERLPRGIVALGLVSLFMDMSSEMIHALLPLFLTGTLGASVLVVGLIEGLGEATAQITKLFSGVSSDRSGRRKPLAVLGYGLSAVTKPLFALAGAPSLVLGARLADRIGKGIRGAPRDALVADLVPPAQHGAAYGLRQTMDTVGAIAGPLIAIALMALLAGNIRAVFAYAIIPAVIAVAILVLFVHEPAVKAPPKVRPRLNRANLALLGPGVRIAIWLGVAMTMARFSEAFLILRASEVGLSAVWLPMVLVMMNLIYAFSAWPVGVLSDRIGKTGLLILGFAVLVGADLVLAMGQGLAPVMLGIALWGLHMGLTQGLLSALVAGAAPAALRGTAFGLYNLATGLALLAANALAGALWAGLGSQATFLVGAGFALLAMTGLLVRHRI